MDYYFQGKDLKTNKICLQLLSLKFYTNRGKTCTK